MSASQLLEGLFQASVQLGKAWRDGVRNAVTLPVLTIFGLLMHLLACLVFCTSAPRRNFSYGAMCLGGLVRHPHLWGW